jgi:hypothetical protein
MKGNAIALVAALVATCLAGPATAIVIVDPADWSGGWTFSSYVAGGAGSASSVVEPAGGNPAARLNITTVTPTAADTAYGTAVFGGTSTVAPAAGAAFTLSLDVLSGPGAFGDGQSIQLLVAQAGTVYATNLGVTGSGLASFTTRVYVGAFNGAGFTRISGGGPLTPSFDGTTVTTYGFAAGNTLSQTLTNYYDNFRLEIPSINPPPTQATDAIPTLQTWALVALGLVLATLAAGALRRR